VTLEFILGFVLLLGVLVLAYQYGARYVLDYVVGRNGIYLRVFRFIPLKLVGADAIVECRTMGARDLLVPRTPSSLFAWRLGNRFAATYVVVRTRHWYMRIIVLTPSDPDRFCEQVNRLPGLGPFS